MGKRLEEQKMKNTNTKPPLGCKENLSHFLLGDEIFPLKTWLMRRYPGTLWLAQKVFNYRLSRARRTIQNSFGILAARQRILQQPIKAKLENAKKYAIAAITFDNYIFMTNNIS